MVFDLFQTNEEKAIFEWIWARNCSSFAISEKFNYAEWLSVLYFWTTITTLRAQIRVWAQITVHQVQTWWMLEYVIVTFKRIMLNWPYSFKRDNNILQHHVWAWCTVIWAQTLIWALRIVIVTKNTAHSAIQHNSIFSEISEYFFLVSVPQIMKSINFFERFVQKSFTEGPHFIIIH